MSPLRFPSLLSLLLAFLLGAVAAQAQEFPKLTGRVVDVANLLDPQQEAALAAKLEALEKASSRQLVVATVPDLGGYPIEDYGYRLGRAWGIGQSEANNGTILLVAPAERKVRIEVGYGLEPILTDALTALIIHNAVLPRFREGDMAGGILAGADAVIQQLQAPPEEAEQRALAAAAAAQESRQSGGGGGSLFPLIFWGVVLVFIVIPMLRGRGRGRRTRRGGMPVVLWGPGLGGGGGGFGGGGGGFGGFGGGGGGFSGGGGSFGGGGASGGW